MTTEDKRQPGRFDSWVMEHSTAALLVGLALAAVGFVLGVLGRSGSDLAEVLQWVVFAPAMVIIGMSGRARSMDKSSRR